MLPKRTLNTLLEKAIQIAINAHTGQFDKGGKPYILHPLWVMHKVRHLGTIYMIVGVLHDVVEDTKWTLQDLKEVGFPPEVIEALRLLDMRDKDYHTRIAEIATNNIAREVKMRDIEHNSKPNRLKNVRQKDFDRIVKYHKAFKYLKDSKG